MSVTGFQRRRRELVSKMRTEATKTVEEPPKGLADLTNKELKTLLDEKGIEYDAKANKATLIELLEGAE